MTLDDISKSRARLDRVLVLLQRAYPDYNVRGYVSGLNVQIHKDNSGKRYSRLTVYWIANWQEHEAAFIIQVGETEENFVEMEKSAIDSIERLSKG